MKCNVCGQEFGNGAYCQHCNADRITALGNYSGGYNAPDIPKNVASNTSPGGSGPTSGYSYSNEQGPNCTNKQSRAENGGEQFMICYHCTNVIPADSEYCPCCRTKLFEICPKCGHRYSSQYKICNKCGTDREHILDEQKINERRIHEEDKIREAEWTRQLAEWRTELEKHRILKRERQEEERKEQEEIRKQEVQRQREIEEGLRKEQLRKEEAERQRRREEESARPQIISFEYKKNSDNLSIEVFWNTKNCSYCNILMRDKEENTWKCPQCYRNLPLFGGSCRISTYDILYNDLADNLLRSRYVIIIRLEAGNRNGFSDIREFDINVYSPLLGYTRIE